MQDIAIETATAINAVRLSAAYSTAVADLALKTEETMAQTLPQMMAPPMPAGEYIDTYA